MHDNYRFQFLNIVITSRYYNGNISKVVFGSGNIFLQKKNRTTQPADIKTQ